MLHLLSYSWFDMGFDVADIAKDIAKRPFILVGFTGFLLLTPLAATSFNRAVKALGAKRWQALHKLVYVIAGLGILHFFWMRAGKNDFAEVAVYAAILAVLLGWRAASQCGSESGPLQAHLVGRGLPLADEVGAIAIDQHFGGAAAGVVVAGHAHAVGAGGQHRQQVARLRPPRRGRGRSSRRSRTRAPPRRRSAA